MDVCQPQPVRELSVCVAGPPRPPAGTRSPGRSWPGCLSAGFVTSAGSLTGRTNIECGLLWGHIEQRILALVLPFLYILGLYV